MVNAIEYITDETLDCRCVASLAPLNPRKFPDIYLPSLDGGTIYVGGEYNGYQVIEYIYALRCRICLAPTTPPQAGRCCCTCFKIAWPGIDDCPTLFDAGIRTIYLVANTDVCEKHEDNVQEGSVVCRWQSMCGSNIQAELVIVYEHVGDVEPLHATLTLYFYGDGSFSTYAVYRRDGDPVTCSEGGTMGLIEINNDSGCVIDFPLSLELETSRCIERRPGLCPANDGSPVGLTLVATLDEDGNRSEGGYFAGRTEFTLTAVGGDNTNSESDWRWPATGDTNGQYITITCSSPCSAYGWFTIRMVSDQPFNSQAYETEIHTPFDSDTEIEIPRATGSQAPAKYIVKLNW